MSSQVIALAVALAVAGAQGGAAAEQRAPAVSGPPTAPLRAGLVVEAPTLGEAGPALERRLQARGELVLRDAEVLPADSEGDPQIEVTVEALPDAAGYRCIFRVVADGEELEGARTTTECRICTDDELAKQVGEAVGRVVNRLETARSAADDRQDAPPPPTSLSPPAPRWIVGKLGGAGIGLTAGGALVSGLGMGLAIAPPLVRDGNARSGSALGLAGVAVAVTGGAMLVSGVVMMLLDRKRSRARSASRRE